MGTPGAAGGRKGHPGVHTPGLSLSSPRGLGQRPLLATLSRASYKKALVFPSRTLSFFRSPPG